MAGTALQEFTDFVNLTPAVYLTSPEEFINEAAIRMPLLGRLLRGRNMSQVLQGGKKIQDIIQLGVTLTGGHYKPMAPISFVNTQDGTLHSVNWRFFREYMTWNDKEIGLNVPDGASASGRARFYKSVLFKKEQSLWTKIFNGLDNSLMADPANQQSEMEADDGELPYSLYALINEETNGLADGWVAATGKAGIDASVEASWRPTTQLYDYADPDDEDGDHDGLLDAFESVFQNLKWDPVGDIPGKDQYFTKSGFDPARRVILASAGGVSFYHRRLQERNDTLASTGDPHFMKPMFAGASVHQLSQMGTASWYQTATSARASELGASVSTTGYRYIWLDGNFITPIFHKNKYFLPTESYRLQGQPDTFARVYDTWWNLFPNSLQRHAMVSPGA